MQQGMSATPKFSVVVPVLNSRAYLRESLGSIRRAIALHGDVELVVMDNGSTDGSYEMLLADYASFARIEQVKGVTVGALRNLGAALTRCDILVFLDSDCVIPEDYFDQALQVLQTKRVDATGSKVSLPECPNWVEKVWYAMHSTQREGYRNYINSGNLVVRKSAFDAVGGFDGALVTGEDSDLCIRLNQRGYKVYVAPSVRAIHLANDKTLTVFFRKHIWRGLGMFGSRRGRRLSKPVLMTLAHMGFALLAIASLFIGAFPVVARVGFALILVSVVPLLAVFYRIAEAGVRVPLAQAVLLYQLYFLARMVSLFRIAASQLSRSKGDHESVAVNGTAPADKAGSVHTT
jgi:GT2 family glycosyltransferase